MVHKMISLLTYLHLWHTLGREQYISFTIQNSWSDCYYIIHLKAPGHRFTWLLRKYTLFNINNDFCLSAKDLIRLHVNIIHTCNVSFHPLAFETSKVLQHLLYYSIKFYFVCKKKRLYKTIHIWKPDIL